MLAVAAVALLLSLGVTFLAYRVLKLRTQPAEATTRIVAAAKKLELGARITKDDVKLVSWPKGTPLEGSFSDIESVLDRALFTALQINEPILESKLAPKEAGAGLTAIIPPGMRALSIQVNSIIGVAGFVRPGSRVDLILISKPPSDVKGARQDEVASKIILEHLEVLAAGQNVQRDVDGKPQTVQDVTLLVTPEQAQKVALATQDGRIQLALRNLMDKEAAEPPLVTRNALYTGPTMDIPGAPRKQQLPEQPPAPRKAPAPRRPAPAAVKAPAPAPAPVIRTITVELIQGAKRVTQDFEAAGSETEQASAPPETN